MSEELIPLQPTAEELQARHVQFLLRLAADAITSEPFSDHDRRTALLAVSGLVGVIEGQNHLLEELRGQATTDVLTGLPNRRALENQDQRQRFHIGQPDTDAEDRRQQPITGYMVEYIDLDDFKLINDVLGHETGDRVLRVFSNLLSYSVRPHDEVYRIGGDEFIVIAPMIASTPDDYSFANTLDGRLKNMLTMVLAPEGSDLLPEDFTLTSDDVEALRVVGFTIGENIVPGQDINRTAELNAAEGRMRELKGPGRS